MKMPVLSILCAWSFSFGGQLHLKDGSLAILSLGDGFPFQIPTAETYALATKVVMVSLFALNSPCFLVSLFWDKFTLHFLNSFS